MNVPHRGCHGDLADLAVRKLRSEACVKFELSMKKQLIVEDTM
jgi:hypothetical protein